MRETEMPGCCAAVVLWDLKFKTPEAGALEITNSIRENSDMKLFTATTAVGGGDNRPDHRQHEQTQLIAEKALKLAGFKCLKAVTNVTHHHPDTRVRLWWYRNEIVK